MTESRESRGSGAPPAVAPAIPPPAEIAAALSKRVIGQSLAIQEMSIGLTKKLAGLGTGNILMIGSSGTGKTTLMRAVETYLAADPRLAIRSTVIRIHANVLGDEAEGGRPGQLVLRRLLERAREQLGTAAAPDDYLARARQGLVFVDEVDKIRSVVGGVPNVRGIRAQEALLTLIENEAVPLDLPAWLGGGTTIVDSSAVLFVCGGAFEGLHDAVFDRVTIGEDKGALRPVTVVSDGKVREELQFHLRDWMRNDDLFDYGMTPQFLARFDSIVLLHDLGVDDLVRIFLETPDSGLAQTKSYFESRGIQVAISAAAVRAVAAAAARQPRLGARAMKEVFRRVVRDLEFEPEKHARQGVVFIDKPDVEKAVGALG